MANIVELKDGSGTKAYPITKAEAVYYDEDYYTDEKIKALEIEAKTNGPIMPIYIGDYIISTNYLPSSIVKVGNYFYVLNAPSNSYASTNNTEVGKLKVFDVSTNSEVTSMAKDIIVAHANSMCYYPAENAFYVTPSHTYENGTVVYPTTIYKYNIDFSERTVIDVGMTASAIAYDYVTGNMYYRTHISKYSQAIYKYVDGSWELYTTIDLTGIGDTYIISSVTNRSYNQDFAVKDNVFYLSSPHGNIAYGELTEGTCRPVGQYNLSNIDLGYQYRIGELEGFEFDEDGHLYAIQYTSLTGNCMNGFVTEIPIGKSYATESSGSLFTVHNGTVTYLGTNDPTFAINDTSIRSINQLRAKTQTPNQLRIYADTVVVEEFPVIVDGSITVDILGEFQTMPIEIQRDTLAITASGSNNKIKALDPTRGLITLSNRTANVKIAGQYTLNVDLNGSVLTSSNLIIPSYGYGHITTRNRPVRVDSSNIPLMLSTTPILQYSEYIGTKNLSYVNEPTVDWTVNTYFAAIITNSARQVRFYMPSTQEFVNSITSGTIQSGQINVRGPEGYITTSLDLTDSSYSTTVVVQRRGITVYVEYPSAITPPSGSVFSSYNNIPISVQVLTDLVVSLTYS